MAYSYVFGGDTGETQESLAKRRALVDAMVARAQGSSPRNLGEGINAIGQAIASGIAGNSLRADEASVRAKGDAVFGSLAKAMMAGSGMPSAPVVPDASTSVLAGPNTNPSDVATGIRESASTLGIDPVDLGTAISYETAGTFDPLKKGPTTQWGQHRGYIQFGEPQAEKYGVDWQNPVGSQLGARGAIVKYLADAGVKPGMGMMDIYSAINAGRVGRYGASDANNGGAPGTVADKVNNQMAGHRAKAMALLGSDQPTQVASLDQGFMPSTQKPAGAREAIAMAMMPQSQPSALVPLPAPQKVEPNPVPPSQFSPAVEHAAAADPMFDGFARNGATEPQAMGGGNRVAQLMEASSSPYLSEKQQALVGVMLEQEFKKQELADKRAFEATDPDVLQKRRLVDAQIAALGAKEPNATDDTKEYEYAVKNGYTGSFTDYQLSQKKAGASSTTVNTGSDSNKFYEEADKARSKSFVDLADAGATAQRSMIQIEELGSTLDRIGTGSAASLKAIAGQYGIPVDGLDDIQAAQALINQLVPAQRPPGSGTMSDGDVALFKRSLPSLINQPGGNATILQTMKGIAQYDAARGDIANRVLDREITPAEGRKLMGELPNPLAEFRQLKKDSPDTVQPVNSGGVPSGAEVPTNAVARPSTDAEYNALPKGALFIDPDDGKTYRKP